jgi:hypothetical protein
MRLVSIPARSPGIHLRAEDRPVRGLIHIESHGSTLVSRNGHAFTVFFFDIRDGHWTLLNEMSQWDRN